MDIMEGAIAHNLENGDYRTSDVAAGQAKSFSAINHLKREVLHGLQRNNFVTPTKIQAAAIPMALTGMDLLVQSKSGTGKTLIYVVAAIQMVNKLVKRPQVLIIVPTRELAIQVESTFHSLDMTLAYAFIGGTDHTKDRQRMLQSRIVIGTLGRLVHLYESKVFNMSEIKMLVLDEADQLYMTKELKRTIGRLIGYLPKQRQIIACSATYENKLDEHLAKLMLKPILISNSERATVLLGIRQFVYELPDQVNGIEDMRRKVEALRKIIAHLPYEQAILFSNSLMRADSFRNYLNASDIRCDLISGALSQNKRLEAFDAYRRFTIRTMVATDLMARGVDSAYVNLVINLDIPRDHVTYLHRIGRAGRFGSKGIAITLISTSQSERFKEMLGQIGTGMSVLHFPQEESKQKSIPFWDFDTYKLPYYVKENGDKTNDAEVKKKSLEQLQELSMNASSSVNIVFQSPKKGDHSPEADYVRVSLPDLQTPSPSEPISSTDNHRKERSLSSMDLQAPPPAAPNSINTKTYCLVVPNNNEPSSTTLQPLGISNTVDDASSIISDSLECGYSSDASFISFYESKDERLIWSHFQVQQRQIKRHQLSAKKRHIFYPWRPIWSRFQVQQRQIQRYQLTAKKRQILYPWRRQEKKPKIKKMPKNSYLCADDPIMFHLLELGLLDWEMTKKTFPIDSRPLLADRTQIELLKKFQNWQEIKQSLHKYIKKRNWGVIRSSKWLDQLIDAVHQLYYSKVKPRKLDNIPQMKEPSMPTFMESLNKSKPNLVDKAPSQPPPLPPSLGKLSVHVAHQLNIPGSVNFAANVEDVAAGAGAAAVPAPPPNDNFSERSSSSFEIHVIEDSSDSDDGDEGDGSEVEPNSSSGFDERNESPSSGIDTSKYDTDSSENYQFVDDVDDSYEEDGDDDEDSYDTDENYFAQELTAESTVSFSTEDEEDGEDSQPASICDKDDKDNTEDDDDEDNGEEAAGGSNALVGAQCRWQRIFIMQYQFIASYVNNYMVNAHPEL